MKELEVKEMELRNELEQVQEYINAIDEEIANCIANELDYIDYELELNKLIDKKRELNKKIYILQDAQDVLNGIGM